MPANIEERNFNLIFVKLCRMLSRADNIEVRGLKTKELKNVSFMLKDPTNCVCTALKPVDRVYLFSELLWYLSGDTSSKVISLYASLWKEISDAEGQVNSNYGYTLFHENQFAFMIDMLSQDRYSRKAVASLNLPEHKLNMKDFPCTMFMQLYIRNDYLNMSVFMRSNDLIYGTRYDIVFFSLVLQLAYLILKKKYANLKLGFMHHFATSLHVYEKHYLIIDMSKDANIKDADVTLFKIDDTFLDDLTHGTRKSTLMKTMCDVTKYPVKLGKIDFNYSI
jgi:thymidylate synthase